jgi:hypothetical protein
MAPDKRGPRGLSDDGAMPDDPTDTARAGVFVPPTPADPVIVVPPGADSPRRGTLAELFEPRWRSIVTSVSIMLVIAVVLLIVLPHPHDSAVKIVDPAHAVAEATKAAPEIVHLPDPLPAGWRVDSAHFEVTAPGAHLHIGYAGPDNGINGLEESNFTPLHTDIKVFVAQMTADGKLINLVTINGVVWAHDVSTRLADQQSLIYYGPTTTTIVTGTSSLANLTNLATSLHIS